MGNRGNTLLFSLLMLPVLTILFTTCSINREDIFKLAYTPFLPEIEVLGYPNETGLFDFGSVDLYTTDSETFTIMNKGREELMITGISFVEDDADWFNLDSSAISSIVKPQEGTYFTVKFKPTLSMSKSVTIIILSNCPENNPYTFVVKGTGTGEPVFIPDINVRQGTADIGAGGLSDFGDVQIENSSSKVFTIENKGIGELSILDISLAPGGGTDVGEFSLVAPYIPTSLAEGDSVGFTVVFSPKDIGIKSATVSISNDDPDEDPYTFDVQGNGVAPPVPDINLKQGENDIPDVYGSYDFGFVQCASLSPWVTFTIENTGTVDLTITNILLADSTDFNINIPTIPFNVPPGTIRDFTIQFSPDFPQEYKSTIVSIDNNDPDENPYTFTVEGDGVLAIVPDINLAEVAFNSTYDFGPVLLGSSKTETFTIENKGTGDLNIASIVNKNPDKFTVDDSLTSPLVPAGVSTTFDISFTPTDTKSKKATIEIYSDDPDEGQYTFYITAYGTTGTEPDINIRQGTVSYPHGSEFYFPDTEVGKSSEPVAFTVENKGTADLEITSIMLVGKHVGDYEIDYDPKQLILTPGGGMCITAWFVPTKEGRRESKLQIKSNDPNEDIYEIKILGQGI